MLLKIPCLLGITCRKMAQNTTKVIGKNQKRKDREVQRRTNTFGLDYVQVKYPEIYEETMGFYNELRKLYPRKHDLRKTAEFKRFKLDQEKDTMADNLKLVQEKDTTVDNLKPVQEKDTMVDNLQIKIPLWDKGTLSSMQSLETVAEEVLGEGMVYPNLHDEISNELVEHILNELREDPELKDIFNIVETEFEQLGADIDINEDIRLENELLLR